MLASDENNRPADVLIPKFLQFFKHPDSKIRSLAVGCVNNFLLVRSEVLLAHIDPFIEVIILYSLLVSWKMDAAIRESK